MTFRTPSEIMAYEQGAGSRDAEVARLTRERDAALEALRELRNAATVAYKDGRVPALPFVSAGNTIHAIETGAIHHADR